MMTNAMKLSLMLALSTAGMIEAQSCAAPIQLSTALNILAVTKDLSTRLATLEKFMQTMKTVSSDIAVLKKGRPRSTTLTFTIVEHHQSNKNDLYLTARSTNAATASKYGFRGSADYGDIYGGNQQWSVVIPFEFAGSSKWYTEPFAMNFQSARISLYWSVSIGTAPHPSPKPFTYVGLLMNGIGGYHTWTIGGPKRDYKKPWLLNRNSEFENFKVSGQSWGTHNYDDLGAICEYTPWQMNIGTDSFGIMNWGPKRLVVKGMWGMIHGQIKYERKGGTLTTLSSYP